MIVVRALMTEFTFALKVEVGELPWKPTGEDCASTAGSMGSIPGQGT